MTSATDQEKDREWGKRVNKRGRQPPSMVHNPPRALLLVRVLTQAWEQVRFALSIYDALQSWLALAMVLRRRRRARGAGAGKRLRQRRKGFRARACATGRADRSLDASRDQGRCPQPHGEDPS